jgi:hypothetical protein
LNRRAGSYKRIYIWAIALMPSMLEKITALAAGVLTFAASSYLKDM